MFRPPLAPSTAGPTSAWSWHPAQCCCSGDLASGTAVCALSLEPSPGASHVCRQNTAKTSVSSRACPCSCPCLGEAGGGERILTAGECGGPTAGGHLRVLTQVHIGINVGKQTGLGRCHRFPAERSYSRWAEDSRAKNKV